MNLGDLVTFSGRALAGHRLRTALSLLGVTVGVASVVVLTGLGEGARRYVTGEFGSLGSNLLIVMPGKTETTGMTPFLTGAPHDLTLDDAETIARRVPGVRRVAPVSLGGARARAGDHGRDVAIWGTTSELLAVRRIQVRYGRYLPAAEEGGTERICVIGAKIQEELFPGTSALGQDLRVGAERFRVIGVLAHRGTSMGADFDEMIHVPVSRALKMFNRKSLFRILVEVSSREGIPAAKERVIEILKARHQGTEDVTVWTQDAVMATFSRILGLLTAALAGIAGISLTVAGVGIMNVMLVSVSERRREIGLLKALGVTRRQVTAAFLVEASILSTAGGALGILTAVGATRLFRWIVPSFPATAPGWAIASAAALSLAVGLLFGTIPARRAARLEPIAALARR